MAALSMPTGDSSMMDGDPQMADDQGMTQGGDEGMHDDMPSATLDESLMAGKHFNVGDEIVLKITRIGDGTFDVVYATGEGDSNGEDDMPAWKKDLHDTMSSEPNPPSTGPYQKMGNY